MLTPEVIDALLAAGLTAEQLAAAVKADYLQIKQKLDEKRSKNAARQRKSRMSRNVTVTARDMCDETSPLSSPPLSPPAPPLDSPPIIPPSVPPQDFPVSPTLLPLPDGNGLPKEQKPKQLRGTRVDGHLVKTEDGEGVPNTWGYWAMNDLGWSRETVIRVSQDFIDYWQARAGPNGVKLDWFRTWKRWCRTEQEKIEQKAQWERRNGEKKWKS